MITTTKLLKLDAVGAAVSSFSLGVILPYLQDYIGLPSSHMYLLAGIAVIFFLHSLIGAYSTLENKTSYLKRVSILNILYCLLIVIVLLLETDLVKTLGWIYFSTEVVIVLSLGIYECMFSLKKEQ